jgi:hypothetical protein
VGSFRENFPEFWYIMEATQQFLVEGGKLVIVSEGDLVATPTGSWHRAPGGRAFDWSGAHRGPWELALYAAGRQERWRLTNQADSGRSDAFGSASAEDFALHHR